MAYIPPAVACVVFVTPMLIDGFTQLLTKYESNNWKRLATGLFFGYAIIPIAARSVAGIL